jgi:hypothetical protein
MFKNWKSTLAFVIFIGIYIYTVFKPSENDVIETAGYIALISSIFMMFRSDFTKEAINKLVENIKIGK